MTPAPLEPSSLDADGILEDGAAASGLPVPQDAPWLPALRLLVGSARTEGGLHEVGAAALRAKLVGLVEERLRAERLLLEHPEIRDRPLPVRFAVAGLARSGTTFLHRLLSCDPDVAFLPTWQAFHPVPAVDHVPSVDDDGRRAATVERIEAIRAADPDALRIHPLDADAPEEEVFLLQHSFASMLFAIPCPLPGYVAWLNGTDHEGAYRFAFDLIRLNEWALDAPAARPRVMKSPQFVLDLAVVARLLPEGVIVQTHRDPVDLVGSYCSTYEASRRRACRSVDPHALGRERLTQLAAMAERALAERERATARGDDGRFVDVHYARLVAEPLRVVEEVYAGAGLEVTAAARQAMTAWLDANPQHKAGRHDYDLARYGLDRRAVESALAPYLERHRPEVEP